MKLTGNFWGSTVVVNRTRTKEFGLQRGVVTDRMDCETGVIARLNKIVELALAEPTVDRGHTPHHLQEVEVAERAN